MVAETSFGRWLQRRRKALDLTQEALAQRVGCAAETLRKIEADARRPSRQIAERLADALELPPDERLAFVRAARAELSTDRLAPPTHSVPQAAFVSAATLPSGTLTFLFTDIEISTQLWERHTAAMAVALTRHDAILRHAIEEHQGVVVKSTGDGIHAVFARAPDALAAALAAQRALHAESWGATGQLRVRMALHTSVAEARDGDYFGPPLNRIARLLAAGHGGQILLSLATAELVRDALPPEVALHGLGVHRLKDLTRPEQIFQALAPDLPTAFPPLNTLDARPNNLLAQPTPLIGRDKDVARLCDLLQHPDTRLVTLSGPGGIGKTRLALQVAAELLDKFPDGVYFVALASITDPTLVATTIAQTLGVQEAGGQPLAEHLSAALREKQMLLLLDNFEQVVVAAPLVSTLLATAPRLKALVTSREILKLRGEKEFAVPPLTLPDPARVPPIEALSQYAAVELFIRQALDVRPDFVVTNENAPAVVEICHRLDGLPLAIELAAARVKLFSAEALLARLGQRLALLVGGARDLPARQQTLRNTIEWSYNLLDAGEQTLFRRLAVFVGGCALEAVTAVCDAAGDVPLDVLDGLTALVDKSLLRQTEGLDGEPRFILPETIREYALEQLSASNEVETMLQGHAVYYLTRIGQTKPTPWEISSELPIEWLEQEHVNLRAALTWSKSVGDAELTVRLASALWGFWEIRGYFYHLKEWLRGILVRLPAPETTSMCAERFRLLSLLVDDVGQKTVLLDQSLALLRAAKDNEGSARVLLMLGSTAYVSGDFSHAARLLTESLALARSQEAPGAMAMALNVLSGMAREQGDYDAARAHLEDALTLRQMIGLRSLADILNGMGNLELDMGNVERAQAWYQEAMNLAQEGGDRYMLAWSLRNLGRVAHARSDDERARALLLESVLLWCEQSFTYGIGCCLDALAGVAEAQGQPERAARLFGAAQALRIGSHWTQWSWPIGARVDYERDMVAVRTQLDEATFASAWAEGRAMSLEQAIAEALQGRV
jgi:predicted ATPase/class 3 adenylate cyclase